MPRRYSGLTAIHILLVVALLEVAVNRVVVEMLRPVEGEEPATWYTLLDYAGLFLFYFAGALAALVILARCVSVLSPGRPPSPEASERTDAWVGAAASLRERIAYGALGVAALVASIPLVVAVPAWMTFLIELAFAAAVLATVASVLGSDRDLGVRFGLPILAVPLLLHTYLFLLEKLEYPDGVFYAAGAPGEGYRLGAMVAISLAALATPYCFAPRPFARAVTKPIPIVIAMAFAALGAVISNVKYPQLVQVADLAFGVFLDRDGGRDTKLALYLLAVATLMWTLSACATAETSGRRQIGMGIALVLLGGYDFEWPQHFLLPLLGLSLIADAARRVREQELDAMPYVADAPPVSDATWRTFVGTATQGLRRVLDEVHSLTSRGEGGLTSTLVVGTGRGLPVRTRIERIEGCVVALDVVIGRENDELRGSSVTVWAMPERGLGSNPAGPPAAPLFKSGDAAFDEKFRLRGSEAAFSALFDEAARARALPALDGWLAYWQGEGLRYRVYPGRGAPLDHPLPLSDLALGRLPQNAERLVAVIELLVEVAARVLPPAPAQPQALADGEPVEEDAS